jgi:hypothetical protein
MQENGAAHRAAREIGGAVCLVGGEVASRAARGAARDLGRSVLRSRYRHAC